MLKKFQLCSKLINSGRELHNGYKKHIQLLEQVNITINQDNKDSGISI